MSTELVEIVVPLPHPPERVWSVLADLERYPRFVRDLAWSERIGPRGPGTGARYLVRYLVEGRSPVDDEIEILVRREPEHLVLVSPNWLGGHVSMRIEQTAAGGTELALVFSLPAAVTDGTVLSASWIRKRVKHAATLIDHHLSGIPIAGSRGRADQMVSQQSKLAAARILARAGVLAPSRPDRMLRQFNALSRWGPTLVGGYRSAAAVAPHVTAILDERGPLTFAEVDRRTTRLANGLAEYGVHEGGKVALMCRNHAGLIESAIACGKLGADVVLLNTGLSAEQITDVVYAHRPAALLADDEFSALFHGTPPDLPWISTWDPQPGQESVDTLIEDSSSAAVRKPKNAGRLIVLTSGTTGSPKGARRRNPPGLSAAASLLSRIPLRVGERMLVAAPLFHTWGLAAAQLSMPLRATVVLQRRFDALAVLEAVAEHRCTALIAVPIMLQRILDLPEELRTRHDLSSLRVVASSGSAMSGRFVTAFMDTFGDLLYNLYGSTEVSWASIADPVDLRAAPTTAGRCPVGTRVRIVDQHGAPVAPGMVGRICVGNEMLFEGYTDGSHNLVHDDLMVTGDRGFLDADGRLFVSGRDDDMIVSGGENVFPRPIEELLLRLPAVADAAVVGVSDREFGQRFAAYVELHPGVQLSEDAIRAYVHDHLARFAVPRDVYFVSAIPRNSTGKVVKRWLME